MFRFLLLKILFSLLLLSLNSPAGEAQAVLWDEIAPLAQKYVKNRRNEGLVIGVIRPGTTEVQGFGNLSREDQRAPDEHSIFEIGGLTSVFTTSAVLLAARDYPFEIDDPVQPYLSVKAPVFQSQICMEITLPNHERIVSCSPDPLGEEVCISFCDLASHTSGLTCSCENGYEWNPFVAVRYKEDDFFDISEEALLLSLSDFELHTAPGSKFRYSNMGMALLGHVVGDIAGGSYAKLLATYLTGPMALPDTRLQLTPEQEKRLAPGHNDRGRLIAPWTFDGMAPAAGLRSTAADLLKFLQQNLNSSDPVLAAVLEQVRQPRVDVSFPGWQRSTQAGYGWLISLLSQESNLPVYWINGGTGGCRSWMGMVLDTGTALVILSNSAQPVDDLAWEILEQLHQF